MFKVLKAVFDNIKRDYLSNKDVMRMKQSIKKNDDTMQKKQSKTTALSESHAK